MEKGYFNTNLLIKGKDSKPLAVCKYFPENEIFKSEKRFEREVNALTLFGGSISPNLIWKKKPNLIVYEYLPGEEILNVKIDDTIISKIKDTISKTHKIAIKKRNPIKEDVTSYYKDLNSIYSNSALDYPEKLLNDFMILIYKQEELLDKYKENLTFIHGDLVPPNLIVNDKIKLIDWEFYRPELSFFDYQYFNYYAKAHSLDISLEIEPDIAEFYNDLVDVLERLWRFGYLKESKKIFYKID
ncbi:MAG: phosphotransferase [Candidatus Heimdallarchaeota archaeon]|nr:phosphotransferase [Candidatus Heimdallarchaeota archaeon]